jgi:phage gp46-like protein
MTDISTIWDVARGQGDWIIEGAALASGDDLVTATLISLFTDRTAEDSDVIPDGGVDRRGWWGDTGQDVPIGSRLWLLSRSKLTGAVATAAKGYASESLAWMLADGVAVDVQVTAVIVLPRQLRLTVTILRADGTKASLAYDWAWAQITA